MGLRTRAGGAIDCNRRAAHRTTPRFARPAVNLSDPPYGDHPSLRLLSVLAISIEEGRELRALIGHEHGDQFRRLGVARIGRNQMRRTRGLEEGLADLEGLDWTSGKLGTDFALGDVGGHRTGMAMGACETSG